MVFQETPGLYFLSENSVKLFHFQTILDSIFVGLKEHPWFSMKFPAFLHSWNNGRKTVSDNSKLS